MKDATKKVLRPVVRRLQTIGVNPVALMQLKNYRRFKNDRKKWVNAGGKITHNYMILGDYDDGAGKNSGHYFHQDLLVAQYIHDNKPKRHVDIGSRIDGFVAHVASFRVIEVVDIRPAADSNHTNIRFVQGDLMQPSTIGTADSVSCLHAVEHFGLGRYTDPIDINGHHKALSNLVDMVEAGGTLYISFPIGMSNEVHFNAHRVLHPLEVFKNKDVANKMTLRRFDLVTDDGALLKDITVEKSIDAVRYGCGIYTFQKTQ